jgi:heme exporter protein A
MWKIVGKNICQKFNKISVFQNISFDLRSGQSIVFTGPNGSGKTTLVRILCNLIRPFNGEIFYYHQDIEISSDQLYPYVGLVGPYLQLYNHLTAFENYRFFARIRGLPVILSHFKELMGNMGLAGREFDELLTYSSGMLQRVKYVMALVHSPHILCLDEPTVNMDEDGAKIVYDIMESQKKDKILIFATNEPEEIRFGEKQISLIS